MNYWISFCLIEIERNLGTNSTDNNSTNFSNTEISIFIQIGRISLNTHPSIHLSAGIIQSAVYEQEHFARISSLCNSRLIRKFGLGRIVSFFRFIILEKYHPYIPYRPYRYINHIAHDMCRLWFKCVFTIEKKNHSIQAYKICVVASTNKSGSSHLCVLSSVVEIVVRQLHHDRNCL